MKTAAVIGAGFGGLALAIRLQSAGIATTLVEARDRPGGRAYAWEKDGFTFDAGPTAFTDPDGLAELWRLSGRDIGEDVELLPVSPFYRLMWPDGTSFDQSGDEAALTRQIASLNPEDVDGYRRLLDYAGEAYREGYQRLGDASFPDWKSMARVAPQLIKSQAWRSVHSIVSSLVKDEHLRQAFSFHALLIGGNPLTVSAIYALIHKLERESGIWFPRGGTHALVRAMVAQFERLGGVLRLGDPVVAIDTLGDRVTGLACRSGWSAAFDAVASNADVMHSYRDLLAHSKRGERAVRALERKRFSPSLFAVHFGIRGTFPGIPHHSILFGPRYEGLLTDIFDNGVLSRDFALYLQHPTVTDPGLAPEGCSVFTAMSPVPHLGKLPIDWDEIGPIYADRILDHLEARLIPGLRERLVTRSHYTPADYATDFNAYLGTAFSLEPLRSQSAFFRVHNRDERIPNLYFVGAATHPGAGLPGVVASARGTAALMLDDLRRS